MNVDTPIKQTDSTPVTANGFLHTVWHSLVKPSPLITNEEEQQRSRLLTAVLITVFVVGTLILVIRLIQYPSTINDLDYLGAWAGVFATLGLYYLTRRGYTDFSAAGLIGLMLILFVGIAFAPGSLETLLYFAIIPILLTAIFFSTRHVIWVAASAIIAATLLSQVSSALGFAQVMNANQFIALSTAIVVTYINHTTVLEHIRRTELENAYERVVASEAQLEQRIRERTKDLRLAKEEAEAARHEAEEANRVKSQFLASMSHELRTPLNAILTFTELIALGTFGPVNDEQVDYLQKSLHSGKHLLALINDVLDITKIQSGMMKLFIEDDFDITKELANVTASAEKMLKDKPVKLVTDIDSDFPLLKCDKRRIRQVLLNLISNAVKFTEEGTITLKAKQQTDSILFAVIDTGPGIPEDQHSLIFEPFVQTEAGIKHAGGTGLGLPISKQLIEAHSGQLRVESTPGEGTSFFATLPLSSNFELGEREMTK